MSIRRTKRRIYRRLKANLRRTCYQRSKEEQEWLDAPPVGFEFGSPDFERLLREPPLPSAATAK